MGIVSKIISSPFRLLGKGVSATKNMIVPEDKTSDIEMVTKLKGDSQPLQEYFTSLGNDSTVFKNYLIVWRPNTSDKSKTKVLNELRNIGV